MKAVILAGGKGTRLGKLTAEIPKPMLNIVGKPLLEYHINWLKNYGITEVYITVNYLKDSIIQYFGSGEKFGINIHYYEEKEPLGTVGGVKALEEELSNDFIVVYGDVMIEMDLKRLMNFHQVSQSAGTLVLHPNDHPYDSDLVRINKENRITQFIPKPHDDGNYYPNLVNAGVYILNKKVLSFIESNKKADFGADVFPKLVDQLPFYGYNTPEYLKDMGTPERLVKVESAIVSGKVFRRNLEQKQKAIFLDRDGVINDDTEFIKSTQEMKLLPGVGEAIHQINTSDYLSVVVTNQSVVARNLISENGLQEIHYKMESDLGKEHAYLDAIYYCPHHPDKGYPGENIFYKVECDCRKPKPGMLLQAAERFNIDLSVSYLIGDHERDIQAGKAAGVTTIGVGTGKGFRKTSVKSDYFFHNLKEAVNFIITEPYKNQAEDIIQKVKTDHKSGYIIAIGGNSQSGKTTFSSYLKQRLIQEKISTLKIDLDDWILPKEVRKKQHDVLHNFQHDKLVADLKRILSGGRIDLEGYSKIPGLSPVAQSYLLNNERVIIIEGVIGLALPYLLEISNLKIYKHIDETLHRNRVMEYYNWKGYSPQQCQEQYEMRKRLEYDMIADTAKYADIIV